MFGLVVSSWFGGVTFAQLVVFEVAGGDSLQHRTTAQVFTALRPPPPKKKLETVRWCLSFFR